MDFYNTLVAGADNAGYKDGPFYDARFNNPSGLAFDDKGERLFVADTNNHRVRVIYLNEGNRVETIAGKDIAGKSDGPLSVASFNGPSAIAFLPEDRLAVGDLGNGLIRLIDLKTQSVTTLGATGGVWDMVYYPKDDSLCFSLYEGQGLYEMGLKSRAISPIFNTNPLVPSPRALCVDEGQLIVADYALPSIYRVDIAATTTNAQAAVSLTEVGKGNHVLGLAVTDGIIYALQAGEEPLARIAPFYKPVSLATAWGFMIDNRNKSAEPLLQFPDAQPVGFAASPREARKLYIAHPGASFQSIVSVKDYDFDQWWTNHSSVEANHSPTDFNYPTAKPPKTYRILVIGGSMAFNEAPFKPSEKDTEPGIGLGQAGDQSLLTDTIAKRLEFMLNAQGALQDVDIHFEVLNMDCQNSSHCSWVYYEVPSLVEKYDVDLVLDMANRLGYEDYFERPINKFRDPIRKG